MLNSLLEDENEKMRKKTSASSRSDEKTKRSTEPEEGKEKKFVVAKGR